MHDREDAGLLEIALFLALVVVEEARDIRVALLIGLDDVGVDDGVEFARHKHGLQRLVIGEARPLQVGRGGEFDVLVDLRMPMDRLVGHAIFMFQNAAHPQDRAHLEGLHADLLADEILGALDALLRVHEDEFVAEAPMQKDRNALDVHARVARQQIGGGGDLRDIELAVAQETPVARAGIDVGEHGQIDAIHLHGALLDGADDFIIATGERQLDIRHGSPLRAGVSA